MQELSTMDDVSLFFFSLGIPFLFEKNDLPTSGTVGHLPRWANNNWADGTILLVFLIPWPAAADVELCVFHVFFCTGTTLECTI
jgi:hypothetical protein